MLFALNPVPFSTAHFDGDGPHNGLSIVKGLLLCDGGELVIECRRYTVLGHPRDELREVRVPLADVVHLRFEARMFRRKGAIDLRVRTHRYLEEVPGSQNGSLRVEIARADLEDAERFCLDVSQAVMRTRTDLLSDHIARADDARGDDE